MIALPVKRLNATELAVRAEAVLNESQSLENAIQARQLINSALQLEPNRVFVLWMVMFVLQQELERDPRADHARIAKEMGDVTRRAIQLDASDPVAWNIRWQALSV